MIREADQVDNVEVHNRYANEVDVFHRVHFWKSLEEVGTDGLWTERAAESGAQIPRNIFQHPAFRGQVVHARSVAFVRQVPSVRNCQSTHSRSWLTGAAVVEARDAATSLTRLVLKGAQLARTDSETRIEQAQQDRKCRLISKDSSLPEFVDAKTRALWFARHETLSDSA